MTIQTAAADAWFDIIMLREAMLLPGKVVQSLEELSLPLSPPRRTSYRIRRCCPCVTGCDSWLCSSVR